MERSTKIDEILKNQVHAIQLTEGLKAQIESLLNPKKPEYLTLKQAVNLLNRSYPIVLKYIKDEKITPMVIGHTKSYKYKDIEALAIKLGIAQKNLS